MISSTFGELLIASALFTVISLSPATVRADEVRVIDGDTLDIGNIRYRLHGIDAPEAGQKCEGRTGKRWSCGKEAIKALESAVLHAKHVACDNRGDDGRNRVIGVCTVDGIDINSWLVQMGYAWAYTKFSDDYVPHERHARKAKLGVFQVGTQTPWDYRAARWDVGVQQSPDGCPIKGNISANGRIYHPPWSPWYGRTKVSTSKGERWFCDEAEAIRAGWRAPQRGRKRLAAQIGHDNGNLNEL